ncbi:hypothetical protein KHQ89_08240 [Mycoplasmatota bacterium]|nr:hypothetical protein KHQ89_08240 [Mycoplasmatota bacterium]
MVTGLLVGASDYYDALSDDDDTNDLSFDTVGVSAASKYVVEYTLNAPTPYFLSNLTYSPFLPVSQAYLDEQGTDFGASENNILVNGAFRITEHITENYIGYTKNETYWDAEHVYVNTVGKRFVPGTRTDSTLREWYEAGYIDAFSVNSNDEEGYATYVLGEDETGTIQNPADSNTNGVLSVGGATYIGYFNFVRENYEYSVAADNKDAAAKEATSEALLNVDFRLGFLYGLNILERLEYYNPEQPEQWLMRGYTIRELTAWDGKDYADYVDDVFNEEQGTTGVTLTGIEQGSDPIYDADKSADYFADAKAELLANGLTEADFPIQVDVIGSMSATVQAYETRMYDALEDASNGVIEIAYNIPQSDQQDSEWGYVVNNYDFSLWSGWGQIMQIHKHSFTQ